MPFIGDSRRRQLRRLSTKRVAQASTPSKDSAKPGGNSSESTPVVKQRRMSRASKHDGTKAIPPCITDHRQDSGSSRTSSKDHVNVFAFMESGGPSSGTDTEQVVNDVPALSSSGSSTSSRSPQLQSPCSDLEVHATESKGGFVWYDNHRRENSINSDSGVSMLSTSPVEESPVLGYKSKSYRYNDITPTTSHTRVMSGFAPDSVPETPAAHMSHIPSLDMHFMKEPEAYYGSSPYAHPPTPRTATARYPQPGLQAPWQSSPRQPSLGSLPSPTQTQVQVEKSGYDLLASAIDSRDQKFLTPIYRKFETLNNRILLYLQDEIAEMEDTLKKLDVAITQEEGRGTKPRTEAIYPSQLKWHRQELMCRIFTKVEQYSELSVALKHLDTADRILSRLRSLVLQQPYQNPCPSFQIRRKLVQELDLRVRAPRQARNRFPAQRGRPHDGVTATSQGIGIPRCYTYHGGCSRACIDYRRIQGRAAVTGTSCHQSDNGCRLLMHSGAERSFGHGEYPGLEASNCRVSFVRWTWPLTAC